jgi:hypothetical protein
LQAHLFQLEHKNIILVEPRDFEFSRGLDPSKAPAGLKPENVLLRHQLKIALRRAMPEAQDTKNLLQLNRRLRLQGIWLDFELNPRL